MLSQGDWIAAKSLLEEESDRAYGDTKDWATQEKAWFLFTYLDHISQS